jgi:hypothetical protein
VETIDVLAGVDALEDGPFVDSARQWQLDENPVNARVGIQLVDGLEQDALRRFGRQAKGLADHSRGVARALLVSHVNLAGGDVADQDDRQSRRHASLGFQASDFVRDVLSNLLRERFPVEDPRCHSRMPSFDDFVVTPPS